MYQLEDGGVIRKSDGAHIPIDPGNKDYRAYQQWLVEGGKPNPAVSESPPVPDKVTLLINALVKKGIIKLTDL
jgi:hypothetical protein